MKSWWCSWGHSPVRLRNSDSRLRRGAEGTGPGSHGLRAAVASAGFGRPLVVGLGQLLVSSWEEELGMDQLELAVHLCGCPSLICDDQSRVLATPSLLPFNVTQLHQGDTAQDTTPAIKAALCCANRF